jgi:hypothetical protein
MSGINAKDKPIGVIPNLVCVLQLFQLYHAFPTFAEAIRLVRSDESEYILRDIALPI